MLGHHCAMTRVLSVNLGRVRPIEIDGRKQFLAGLVIWHELFDSVRASGTANLFNRIAAESPTPTSVLPALETVLRQNT